MSLDSSRLMIPRTLVLCFDGTSNQYDGSNTNIVKFYALLKKDATERQLCYYQPGIGTYIQPGVVSPFLEWGAKILDEAVAWYLNAHVRGGYLFLMQNWRPGDKICIFGFSRGAYTARALAGMLHKIGLLPKDNPEQLPLAYKLYKRTDAEGIQLAAGFKQTFCRDVIIEFVGVWDTVSSVGILASRTLPFTTTNTTIKTFRHALALDEHRAKFRPNLYHREAPSPGDAAKDPEHASFCATGGSAPTTMSKASTTTEIYKKIKPKGRHISLKKAKAWMPFSGNAGKIGVRRDPDSDPSGHDNTETNVLEVWFAGCHSDVGGGAVTNEVVHSLSDISLRWMVRQIALAQCGITFDQTAMARANISDGIPVLPFLLEHQPSGSSPRPSEQGQTQLTLDSMIKEEPSSQSEGERSFIRAQGSTESPQTGSGDESQNPDNEDALTPIHDQLRQSPMWWLLEIIPTSYSWQDAQGKWHRDIGFHLGKGRKIPDEHPNFHESVKTRMNHIESKYKPRAVWQQGSENYVS